MNGEIGMYLETARLIIRDFCEADAPALYDIKYDEQVRYFCPDFLEVDVSLRDTEEFIRKFNSYEIKKDIDAWRCYAIEHKRSHEVIGCLCFGLQDMLFEYELGWMMKRAFTKNGYATEAASAFSEYICDTHNLSYLIVVMDVDNPASMRCAEKAGFRLFEKRTVYDYSCNRYCDDYYYFRRYSSKCTLASKFYGDIPYEGRIVNTDNE